jgi:hypothetical protein
MSILNFPFGVPNVASFSGMSILNFRFGVL